MANKIANLKITLSYTGPSNESIALPAASVSCYYQAQNQGTVDVPDAATTATSYTIPLGAITLATLAWIENKTGQALTLVVNGDEGENIANGGSALLVGAAAGSVTSLAVKTTATQDGPGLVAYRIFGDPT